MKSTACARVLLAAFCLSFSGWGQIDNTSTSDKKAISPTRDRIPAPQTGAAGTAAAPALGNGINYNGGPVMHGTINVYYIWYGNWGGTSGAHAMTVLQNLASNIGGTPYFNINTTYSDSSGTAVSNSVHFGGSTTDNYSQGTAFGDAGVRAVVSAAITSGRLPNDAAGVYFVLTSADVNETSGFCSQYCGWHTRATISSSDIKYSFVGNGNRCPSSCTAQSNSPNADAGVDGMASVIVHELEEAATDPDLNAWFDANGDENADKCAWTFTPTYAASNGSLANMNLGGTDYLIQRNWVNASGGYCSLAYPPPTLTSVTPSSGAQGTSVQVTLAGTNFIPRATVAVSSPSVSVSNVSVVNATQITATFNIAGNATLGNFNVTVSTTAGISAARTFTITSASVTPTLTGVQCMPSSLSSGQQSSCTVSLSSAPSSATSVSLASNNALVTVPISVTVGVGATSAAFTATAGTIASSGSAVITATLSGSSPVSTTITLTAPAGGGTLAGSVGAPSTAVNLTAEGTGDWSHWGLATATSFDHKGGVTGQISNFSVVGGGAVNRYANNPASFTWTDGTPTVAASSTPTGLYIAGQGMGFRLTAPADTSVRTLKVYVGLWRSQGRMVAQLSDGSAAVYTDTSLNNATGTTIGVYTFTYSAASAGQTLTVTYTQNNATAGNVTLQAATLVGGAAAPNFSVTASPSSQSVIAGTNATSTVTVAALNGFSGTVAFGVSGMPPGVSSAFSPSTVSGSGTSMWTLTTASSTAPGSYPLTLTATSGALTRTTGFTLTVTPINGLLSGVLQAPVGPVALDTQGTLDWAHWGLNTAADFDHKAGVTAQISNFTALGGTANRFANNPVGFSWTGGTPTAGRRIRLLGFTLGGQNSGYRIVVPAGTATRTLRVYIGVWHAQGRMVAHLSDGSAVDYVDTSLNNSTVFGTAVGVYTLTYHAASNGQTLTITFTQDTAATGNVTLQAATLQ